MYTLIVLDGPDMGASFKLEPGVTLVGRISSSATPDPAGFQRWELSDVTVSRTHCEIAYSVAGSPVLTHLSQTNQTLVNGKAVDDKTDIGRAYAALRMRGNETKEGRQVAEAIARLTGT